MIRVLRVLEYEFEDTETAEKNLGNLAVPLNGTKVFGKNKIRSAAFTDFDSIKDKAAEYDEIIEIASSDSLASDGLEMIHAAMRGDS